MDNHQDQMIIIPNVNVRIKMNKLLLTLVLIPSMLFSCGFDKDWIKYIAAYAKLNSPRTSQIMIIQDNQIVVVDIQTGEIQYIFDNKG
jgi:hypothetical protein